MGNCFIASSEKELLVLESDNSNDYKDSGNCYTTCLVLTNRAPKTVTLHAIYLYTYMYMKSTCNMHIHMCSLFMSIIHRYSLFLKQRANEKSGSFLVLPTYSGLLTF